MKSPVTKRRSATNTDPRPDRPPQTEVLAIGGALLKWCSPRSVGMWNDASRALSTFRLERRIKMEVPDEEVLRNASAIQALWEAHERALVGQCARAHSMLENELRWKLANETLFGQGFLVRDGLDVGRALLPRARAGDFAIDSFKSIVVDGKDRYLAVAISCAPFAPAYPELVTGVQPAAQAAPAAISASNIADLTDEILLGILEAYLDRLAASPDAKLRDPGKFSLIPFVARHMRHRAQNGMLLPNLTTEADWLAKWVKAKIDGHHTPTAKTIGKVLGREYAQLKARSNAAIQ